MIRLFEGTQWDRPPRCERCGELDSDCQCASLPDEPPQIPPERQTAIVAVEKRKKGKVVTVITGLEPQPAAIAELFRSLKDACGAGGTIKDESIEIQGDHRSRVIDHLKRLGYRVK